MAKKEKTWLLASLTAVLAAAIAVVVVARMRPIASWWAIGGVALPWFAMSLALRVRDDWGWEGKYVDWWSIPHYLTGALFGLFGIGIAFVVVFAIVWELVEVFSTVPEATTNRVADVVLAAAGWATANVVFGGGFGLL